MHEEDLEWQPEMRKIVFADDSRALSGIKAQCPIEKRSRIDSYGLTMGTVPGIGLVHRRDGPHHDSRAGMGIGECHDDRIILK